MEVTEKQKRLMEKMRQAFFHGDMYATKPFDDWEEANQNTWRRVLRVVERSGMTKEKIAERVMVAYLRNPEIWTKWEELTDQTREDWKRVVDRVEEDLIEAQKPLAKRLYEAERKARQEHACYHSMNNDWDRVDPNVKAAYASVAAKIEAGTL